MEGVFAAFAQFDNDVRSDRTRAGMRAALELGRWVFKAPLGYLNASRAFGKSLVHDPERAPLVRRAFEEYGTGRFTKQEILQKVTTWGLRTLRGMPLIPQTIGTLLTDRLYASIVDVPEFGVRGRRGDFEPLVIEDVLHRAQAAMAGRPRRHGFGVITRNCRELRHLRSPAHGELVKGAEQRPRTPLPTRAAA
jgi:site-specific DNA recombinase